MSDEEKLEARRKKLVEQYAIGPTGQFPQGQLNEHDEGELRVAVGVEGGKVVVHFGKKIAWICMTKTEVHALVRVLLAKADRLPE